MANTHTTLASLFTAIANAIRGKTGATGEIVADDFPDAISLIQTGLDTSDATATASDIAEGVTAYVNGEKVTGNVATYTDFVPYSDASVKGLSDGIRLSKTISKDSLLRSGTEIRMVSDISNFGDATAADVAAGKTFTSAAGLKVTGTHKCETPSGTIEITANGTHDVADYASVEVNVPVEGLDTSEATSPASAGDIAKGKIAFVNGEKVTGTITTYTGAVTFKNSTVDIGSGIYLKQTITKDTLFRTGAEPSFFCDKSNFGDASAADVAKGKTFTSTAGLKVTGTYEGSGIQAQHITSASETITIGGSGTVKVWGYGYKSAQYGGTTYAFVGDGYYSGSHGTPSKTSATFSISNGTLSGLPAGLTALDVLVTIGVS